jgi:D-amino-acid dehydrogenase
VNGSNGASASGKIAIVGGGAVGLSVAEALTVRGADVVVLESDRCGAGASAGNAGWITPSLAIPVPGPGVIAESLRWLVDPSGPLWIRPTLSPALLDWAARFLSSCSRAAYSRGLAALQRASALAGPAFDRLAERGVNFEHHDQPLLYPAFDQPELDHLLAVASELRDAGARNELRRLSPDAVRALEPALDERVIGGVIADGERRVRPELFTAALTSALQARGVELREGAPVTELTRYGGRWLVHTPSGSLGADTVVLAAGVTCARLLDGLGVHLPIAAAKGYSRTYAPDPTAPRRALYLERPKVAVSVFDDGVRVSGTLELGATNLALSHRRLEAISNAAARAMPRWLMPGRPRDWAGMRSLSPDGLPLIGPVPGHERLHLATAHATLGITLGPATGELLADLLLDANKDPLLAAFDPARLVRGRARAATAKATIGGFQ